MVVDFVSTYPFAAVLFDPDGVVIDSMPLHREIWTVFLRSHGLEPSAEDLQRLAGRRAAEVIAEFLPGPPPHPQPLSPERRGEKMTCRSP